MSQIARTPVPDCLRVPFDRDDAQAAMDLWGFNCGPAAICGLLQLTPGQIRLRLRGFEGRGYMSPTMMMDALKMLGRPWRSVQDRPFCHFGLVRVQWGGPWLGEGVPIRARYRYTHWVASRMVDGQAWVFDVNCMCVGGWVPVAEWEGQVAPWIIRECVKRGDGTWYPTHRWEVRQ